MEYGLVKNSPQEQKELEKIFVWYKKSFVDKVQIAVGTVEDIVSAETDHEEFSNFVKVYNDMVHSSVLSLFNSHSGARENVILPFLEKINEVRSLKRTQKYLEGYDPKEQSFLFPQDVTLEEIHGDGKKLVENMDSVKIDYAEVLTEVVEYLGETNPDLQRALDAEEALFEDELSLLQPGISEAQSAPLSHVLSGLYYQLLLKIVSKLGMYKPLFQKTESVYDVGTLSREEAYVHALSKVFKEVISFTLTKHSSKVEGFEYLLRMHELCAYLRTQLRTEEGSKIVHKFFAFGKGVQSIPFEDGNAPALEKQLQVLLADPIPWKTLISRQQVFLFAQKERRR